MLTNIRINWRCQSRKTCGLQIVAYADNETYQNVLFKSQIGAQCGKCPNCGATLILESASEHKG